MLNVCKHIIKDVSFMEEKKICFDPAAVIATKCVVDRAPNCTHIQINTLDKEAK